MEITIKGGSKSEKRLIKSVSKFIQENYFPRRKSVKIEFKVTRMLSYGDSYSGICYRQDKANEFEILIDRSLLLKDFIKVIIHEMIHVKQYLLRELVDRKIKDSYKTYWKGVDYTSAKYNQQPWEIEAYQLQEDLYPKFLAWDILND